MNRELGDFLRDDLRALLFMAVILTIAIAATPSYAVTQSSADGGYTSIQTAFAATQSAGRQGGNVTSLIAQLNSAVALIQKASAENATNPTQAAADLANATKIAQSVTIEAVSVAQMGASATQAADIRSIITASAIAVAAALIYVFGGRVYRRLWLRAYKDYVVRPTNG
jgi:hypothetical protein